MEIANHTFPFPVPGTICSCVSSFFAFRKTQQSPIMEKPWRAYRREEEWKYGVLHRYSCTILIMSFSLSALSQSGCICSYITDQMGQLSIQRSLRKKSGT